MESYTDLNRRYFELQAEKRGVRTACNTVGFTFVASEAVMTVLSVLLSLTFKIALKDPEKILSDSVFLKYANTLLLFVGFIIIPYIACRIAGTKPRKIISLRRINSALFFGALFLAFGFSSVCNIASSYISNLFSFLQSSSSQVSAVTKSETGFLGFLLSAIEVAVVPAFFEEFAFRGVTLGLLRRSMSDGAAIILSAVMFGMMHGNIEQIPFAFCMGVVFAYVTVITDSLFPAMAAHFANNLSSVVLSAISSGAGPAATAMIYALNFIITSAIAILGFAMIANKAKEKSNLSGDFGAPVSTHIKWGIFSPGIVVFIIFIIIRMVLRVG